MRKCKALWIMKQVGEPSLKPDSLKLEGRVEYSQTLYCLLVEIDENRWHRDKMEAYWDWPHSGCQYQS